MTNSPIQIFIKSCILFLGLLLPLFTVGQVVYTDPVFPQQTDNVIVVFDATKGNGALAGFTGPVYAHTGVITSASSSGSDWKHVQGNWGTPDPNVLMTALGNDLYQLEYNIDSYYGINVGETVEQLAFVFRNADGSIVGRDTDGSDIYTPVYSPGSDLLTTIISPDASSLIVEDGSTIEVSAAASLSATLSLYDNSNLLTQTTGTNLSYTINVSGTGNHIVEFVADDGTNQSTQSFQYVVPLANSPQDPPAGTELGINYISDTEVVLSLYAPNKSTVFVLGDFNDWSLNTDYQMRKSLDGNTFWLSIDNLTAGQKYAFQYLVDGIIRIADPYSPEVLDPFNDPFIPDETYPDLLDYPSGATGVISVLQTAAPTYDWQVTDFEAPEEKNLVIYELLLRDFLSRHDYQTLIDTLDYLDRLGINAIELMPINEFEGNISWGYNPSFHMATDKYYGPINEFKRFIDEAHARGMAVILDVVFNHAFSQNPLAQLYWDANNFKPSPDNPWLNPDAKHPFNVGYDFNHESQATKDYVEKIIRYWLVDFKIDGYRFDLSKGFTQVNSGSNVGLWGQYDASRIAILKNYVDVMWEENPNAYAIMEHFGNNTEETEMANYGMMLWGNMNHEYNEATMGYGNNLNGTDYKSRGWNEAKLIPYMESHDEERLMYKNLNFGNASPDGTYNIKDFETGLDRIALASTFYYCIPGPKMIWQFGELGYDFSINYCPNGTINDNCRVDPKPIRWDYRFSPQRLGLYEVTRALIHLRNNYEVFHTNDYNLSVSNSFQKSIHLNAPEMKVTVLGNFNVLATPIDPDFQQTGTWYEYFSGDSIVVNDVNQLLGLNAGEYRIYTTERIPLPNNMMTSTTDLLAQTLDFQLFPNPSAGEVNLVYNLEESASVQIDLYNLVGQQVGRLVKEQQVAGRQALVWNNELARGTYFLKVQVDGRSYTHKFVSLK